MTKLRLILAFFFLLSYSSYANEVIALDAAYPPYMYESKGKIQGLYARLLDEIFQKMEVNVTLEPKPWARVIRLAKKGKWGVGGIYKNAERMKIFDYSSPIYQEELLLFVKKPSTFEFKSLKDLKGKVLALMRGWSYGTEFDKEKNKKTFRVIETSNGEQSFTLLLKERVDGVVMDSVSAKMILEKKKWAARVKEKNTPVARNAAYIAFHKSMKKTNVIKRFNTALIQIKKEGSYNKIISNFVKE